MRVMVRGVRPALYLGSGPGLHVTPHYRRAYRERTPGWLTLRIGCAKREKDRQCICSLQGRSSSGVGHRHDAELCCCCRRSLTYNCTVERDPRLAVPFALVGEGCLIETVEAEMRASEAQKPS